MQSVVDIGKLLPVKQIGGMHGMPGVTQLVSKGEYSGSQPVGVVEEDDFGHVRDSLAHSGHDMRNKLHVSWWRTCYNHAHGLSQ